MHILALEVTIIHPFWVAQIAALQGNKAPTKILVKYSDYTDVFSLDLAIELPKNMEINKHAIELIRRKQPPYRSIYILSLVKLEMLKIYIKTHLKTGFT